MKRTFSFIIAMVLLLCAFTGCSGTSTVYDDSTSSYSQSSTTSYIASRLGVSTSAVNSAALNKVAEMFIEGEVIQNTDGYSDADLSTYVYSEWDEIASIGASEGLSESQILQALGNGKFSNYPTYEEALNALANKYPRLLANARYYGIASRQVYVYNTYKSVIMVVYLT